MSRAQCIVHRGNAVLMVKSIFPDGDIFYCLPGGGIHPGETPEEAALRELYEECGVRGHIIRPTAEVTFGCDPDDRHFTYLVDIGDEEPVMGYDPEFAPDAQMIIGIAWLRLDEMSERDRVFVWSAGLLTVPCFSDEVHGWERDVSYPDQRHSGK